MSQNVTYENRQVGSDLLLKWDTVFAIRYADVNAGIRAGGLSPKSFQEDIPDGEGSYSLVGEFDDWKLVPGGNGHLIQMRLPFRDLVFQTPTDEDYYKYQSGWFEISVPLTSVMRDAETENDGQYVDFMVDATATVSVQDTHLEPAPDPDDDPSNTIGLVMAEWLNTHLADFKHVFGTVNINRILTEEYLQWMQPTATSYAVVDDQKTEASGIFGILCMTENRPKPDQQLVDINAIPDGESSGFLISKERFLRKLLIGGLGYMFDGPATQDANKTWPDDYFALSESGTMIVNTAPVRIDKLVVGKDKPKIKPATIDTECFVVELNDSTLSVKISPLVHQFDHVVIIDLFDVEHTIYNEYIIQLDPETQVIDLTPKTKIVKGQEEIIGTHDVEIWPTKAEKDLEMALIVASIVLAFAPVVGRAAGWIDVVENEAEETASSAIQNTEMRVVASVEEMPVNYLASAEAREAGGFLLNREMPVGAFGSICKAVMGVMALPMLVAGGADGLRRLLEWCADGDKTKLPSYPDFAAEILAPIQWPAAETHYKIHGVQIANSLQTYGDWKIRDTNPL